MSLRESSGIGESFRPGLRGPFWEGSPGNGRSLIPQSGPCGFETWGPQGGVLGASAVSSLGERKKGGADNRNGEVGGGGAPAGSVRCARAGSGGHMPGGRPLRKAQRPAASREVSRQVSESCGPLDSGKCLGGDT